MMALSVSSRTSSAGFQVRGGEGVADVLDELEALKVRGGDIDPHGEVVPPGFRVRPPAPELLHGGLEHPVAQLGNEAGFLGDGDELVRHDQAAGGMLPADQGLDALDPAGGQLNDRLVEQHQLRAGDGLAQFPHQLVPELPGMQHGRFEHPQLVAAVRLGRVHGDVGFHEQLSSDVSPAVRQCAAPCWPRSGWRLAVHVDGSVQGVQDPVAHRRGLGGRGGGQQDGEFVAAQAGHHVRVADAGPDPLPDGGQHLVAHASGPGSH